MPAILNLPGVTLLRFGLGDPPERERDPETQLRWVLESYSTRRDEQWRVEPRAGGLILMRFYYEAVAAGASGALAPILLAFGFYGPAASYARHLAVEQLGSPSTAVVAAAAQALGSFDDASQIDAFEPLSSSPEPGVSRAAFFSCARLARASDLPRLDARAAGDPEREAALQVTRRRLAGLASGDIAGYLKATLSHAAFYEDLVGSAKFALKDLSTLFVRDGALEDSERARCVRVLGLARLRAAAVASSSLHLALDIDAPRFLRLECIRYLGRVRARVADQLCFALDDEDREIVRTTIIALGEIGDGSVIGRLLNTYDTHDGSLNPDIELAAYRMSTGLDAQAYADWASGARDIIPHSVYFFEGGLQMALPQARLLGLLEHPEVEVRREAALLLGISGDATAADPLRRLAASETDSVTRDVATRAASLTATR